MDYRQLGQSGLRVPVLSFGAGTFGGTGPLFSNWGQTEVDEARALIDLCLDAGVTLFDTADVYSAGRSESILGAALEGRRDAVLISTKTGLPMGDGPDEWGVSRGRLVRSVEAALKRLRTDRIDILQLHAYDSHTPPEEILNTIDMLMRSGKVIHWGVSNYPGWALMQLLERADQMNVPRPVVHQVYYSLVGRDYEWDLMPLGAHEGVGAMIWSPLGWGRLTGKLHRGGAVPAVSRLHETASMGPPVDDALLYDVLDVLFEIAAETGRSVPQVAINWLTQQPTVSNVIIGARNRAQLVDNLGAVGWSLDAEQSARLTRVSERDAAYPAAQYRRQEGFARLSAPLVTAEAGQSQSNTSEKAGGGGRPHDFDSTARGGKDISMIELDHVTLRTAHLAATRQFFIDLFDLEEGERPLEIQQIPGHWLYSGDAPVVHLIGSYGRGTPIDGEIIDHIAFRRRGYHDFIARLKARRLPYSCMSLKGLAEHRVFLRAPGGQLIETVFRGEDARRAFDDLGLEPTYG